MSRFFSTKYADLESYTPGEQPQDMQYVKLNTNESPFAAADRAVIGAAHAAEKLHLYCDPECRILTEKLAEHFDVGKRQVLVTNGSDEVLNFAFMAFCDQDTPALFPDVTYGFYQVFAQLNHVPFRQIPLKEDLSVDIEDYKKNEGTVFLANPNANTGLALDMDQVEEILQANPDHVVVIDEAYVDFGAESMIPLTETYDNLLVIQTFSKSWSMAGARLGFGIASEELIGDLNTIKYSTNPYNVNSMTQAAGVGAIEDYGTIRENCLKIIRTREWAADALKQRGFEMTDSIANFLFVRHPKIPGEYLYRKLKEMGILIRHFDGERIREYNRITIGSRQQMQRLMTAIDTILKTMEETK